MSNQVYGELAGEGMALQPEADRAVAEAEPKVSALRASIPNACVRCAVLEDLLETATSERDKARDEASKADREALFHKDQLAEQRYQTLKADRELVKHFRDLARSLGATPEQMLER